MQLFNWRSVKTTLPLMVSRPLVLGYHGCDAVVASKIASGDDQLTVSKNEYDWLGSGQYFWEDSYSRALRWAKDEQARSPDKVKNPAVLGAILDLGNCLNLIDSEHLGLVKAARTAYLDICRTSGLEPVKNKGKDLREKDILTRLVFETLHKLRKKERKASF